MQKLMGLRSDEAAKLLREFGPNQIQSGKRFSTAKLLISQFTDPIMLLLLAATSIAMFLGELIDSIIILAIVIPTAFLSFYQEYRAGQELQALMARVRATARVFRDGKVTELPVDQIVPGDIVTLTVGSQIPADLELLEANQLAIDESALTGESFAVEKQVSELVFLGTHVAGGSATGKVIATGARTKYGELAQRLATSNVKTSFEEGSARFGRFLMKVMLLLVVAIFIVNMFVNRSLFDSLLFSLALAVGMTPQFLTVIITISLTRGASKMAKEKVLVKRLDAIQDFGSMTVLCSDKTGTLTLGDVQLTGWLGLDGSESIRVLELGVSNARCQTGYQNPLDDSILARAEQLLPDFSNPKLLGELPYDFMRKRLSVAIEKNNETLLITKGSFKEVLEICSQVRIGEQLFHISDKRHEVEKLYESHAALGNRVILVASKHLKDASDLKAQEIELTAEGFLVFLDPIKEQSKNSIQKLAQLGVRTLIVTGDNPLTTARVAREVGLPTEPYFTGDDIDQLGDAELTQATKTAAFFAAVNPVQKERIIKAMKSENETIGYFGDGINDSLALRAADVGISVDNAVDVARESADIVLLDKDLDVLAQGLRIGRRTFANTMTYIRVTISASFGNVFSVVVAAAFLDFLPLLPMQILLLNFLSGIPHIAIATDRVDDEDLERPKKWDIPSIRRFMLIFGLLSSAVDILLYWLLVGVYQVEPEVFRSVWFIESLLSELVAMLVLRTKRGFWKSRPGAFLVISCLAVGIAAIAIPFIPWLGPLLGFGLPTFVLLASVAGMLIAYAFANEIFKKRFMI